MLKIRNSSSLYITKFLRKKCYHRKIGSLTQVTISSTEKDLEKLKRTRINLNDSIYLIL